MLRGDMILQTTRLPESVITMGTRVRSLVIVNPKMLPEIVGSEEGLVAHLAHVRATFLLPGRIVAGGFRLFRIVWGGRGVGFFLASG